MPKKKAKEKEDKSNEIHDAIAKNSLDKVLKELQNSFEQEKQRLQHIARQLEENYIKTKRAECEILHNKLVIAIQELSPSPINLLFVLEILKQEALQQSMNLFFAPAPNPSPTTTPPTEGKNK